MIAMTAYHTPVLLEASLGLLLSEGTSSGVFVDATFGGGGHSRGILTRLAAEGRLFAFDQDPDAYANRLTDSRCTLLPVNFRFLAREMGRLEIAGVDGILADLGVSSHQFDSPARGFSFRFDAPLDMRMAPDAPLATGSIVPTAAQLLKELPEEQLYRIFSQYGEFTGASRLARAVVHQRKRKPLAMTGELVQLVNDTLGAQNNATLLAQVFQALRIAVNDELGALEALLTQAQEVLRPGGRLVVISYHSLEDRLVKHLFQTGNLAGKKQTDFFGNPILPWQTLTKKPITPSAEEITENPRARSAKLRAAIYQPQQTEKSHA